MRKIIIPFLLLVMLAVTTSAGTANIIAIQANVTALQNVTNLTTANVLIIKGNLATLNVSFNGLSGTVNGLLANASSLRAGLNNQSANTVTLRAMMANLTTGLSSVQSTVGAIRANLSSDISGFSSITSSVSAISKNQSQLQKSITQVQAELNQNANVSIGTSVANKLYNDNQSLISQANTIATNQRTNNADYFWLVVFVIIAIVASHIIPKVLFRKRKKPEPQTAEQMLAAEKKRKEEEQKLRDTDAGKVKHLKGLIGGSTEALKEMQKSPEYKEALIACNKAKIKLKASGLDIPASSLPEVKQLQEIVQSYGFNLDTSTTEGEDGKPRESKPKSKK